MTSKATLLIGTALVLLFSGSVAMAADLYVPPAAPAAAPVVSTNWDGPYIGASVGYGWGSASNSYTGSIIGTSAASPTGWLVGAQAGYNFHVADSLLLGLEGNLDWVNETGSYGGSYSQDINWEGSVRGRLGWDAGGFLPYVEAGVAFANATYTHTSFASVNNTHVGWTVGAGVEFMLADHLSANVEYRYSDYGTQNYVTSDLGTYNNHVRLTDSTVRVGLNYHF